jgi:hypothetical protein
MNFVQLLKDAAFTNLDITSHTIDLHGWFDKHLLDVLTNYLNKKITHDKIIIIEVGTWKGLSAVNMANTFIHRNFSNFNIITIDTWLGAPEFWTWGLNDTKRGTSLNIVNGYPTVYYTFIKNIKKLGLDKFISPFPISSVQGAEVLLFYNITADIIYIDASHEYKAVLYDLEAYYPLLQSGGLMFGDDYSSGWPGVIKAVDEFSKKKSLKLNINGVIWSFIKM